MALSRTVLTFILTALCLLTIAAKGEAQEPIGSLPKIEPPARPSDPKIPVPAKELSKEEVDGLIEKAFGRDCEELQRVIRFHIADLGMVVAAKEASVGRDGRSVRFTTVSIAFMDEKKVFHGDEAIINSAVSVVKLVKQWTDLGNRGVASVELHNKNSIITLVPTPQGITVNAPNIAMPFEAPPMPKPALEPFPVPNPGPPSINMPPGTAMLPGPRGVEVRFKFKIDAKASLADLLPAPAKASVKLPMWTNEDLAKVAELTFGEPISKELPKVQAMEKTAHVMAKINHLNRKKTDGFMLAMLDQRTDLRGLPVLMGGDCRTREEQAKIFAMVAEVIRQALPRAKTGNGDGLIQFWSMVGEIHLAVQEARGGNERAAFVRENRDPIYRATVAALMQILMPETEQLRIGLAKNLATIPHIDATKALAKLAIFSAEDEVRAAAIEGLKTRRERDYTDILLQGFRYPLPAVSKRAAEALVKLERKDLLANLVEVLESPDPRLPVTEKREGKDVTLVRDLVKVNHHRNCLLCHAPGNTDNTPDGVLKVAVPLPNEPLPKPSEGGGYQSTPPPTPDIVVRLDMTYLRQDFSQMMPVSDAHPWPEMQRFDFMVRTRTLTAAEAQAYEECCEPEEPGRLSPYHRAALFALRELTGRDTEPTAAAWRKLLKLPAR